ncbi:cytochrome C oxidase subunit IV family protein [Persicirhabdus sediminis]|uniref:Cytochrome c oxidase subunit 4 n=1 Tax=Persicirhabdus sediminis TaxID=454144 RepID=A0A8J7MD88_9BACT|nr:cytochrome C oxidase subunit IV family protein [Persicirhabdus sediminis]MBK1790393.1 hypothetical protein [Persicirhabdus sediminis]
MAHSIEEVKKSQKKFLIVGAILFIGTVVTVAVAKIPALDIGVHGFDTADLILGLLIATIKASLVLMIFMHFTGEKFMVYFSMGIAVIFTICMVWLIGWSKADPIQFENEDVFRSGIVTES